MDPSFPPNPSFSLFIFKMPSAPPRASFCPETQHQSLSGLRDVLPGSGTGTDRSGSRGLRCYEKLLPFIVLLWTEVPMCGILIASFMRGMDDYLALQPKDPIPPSLSIWGINSQSLGELQPCSMAMGHCTLYTVPIHQSHKQLCYAPYYLSWASPILGCRG